MVHRVSHGQDRVDAGPSPVGDGGRRLGAPDSPPMEMSRKHRVAASGAMLGGFCAHRTTDIPQEGDFRQEPLHVLLWIISTTLIGCQNHSTTAGSAHRKGGGHYLVIISIRYRRCLGKHTLCVVLGCHCSHNDRLESSRRISRQNPKKECVDFCAKTGGYEAHGLLSYHTRTSSRDGSDYQGLQRRHYGC